MTPIRYAGEEIMADQAETESVSPAPPVSNPAWERVQLARHPKRPHSLDYIQRLFTEFREIHGDRFFGDDHAILGGRREVRALRDALGDGRDDRRVRVTLNH